MAPGIEYHYSVDLHAKCVAHSARNSRAVLLRILILLHFLFIKLQVQLITQRLLPQLPDIFCGVELNHLAFRNTNLAHQAKLLVSKMAHVGVNGAKPLPKYHLEDQVVLPLGTYQFVQSYIPHGRFHGYDLWKPHPGRDWHPFSPIDALEKNGDFLNGRQVGEDAKRVLEVEVIYADLQTADVIEKRKPD